MLECANNIREYINVFHYEPLTTIKNLLNKLGISQEALAFMIDINVRTLKRYLSGEYKLNKKILALICCATNTPQQVSLELFKNAGLELKLLNDDPILFDILEQVGEIESYKLIEKIKKNYK